MTGAVGIKSSNGKLTAQQQRALVLLLEGKSFAAAAREIGVGPDTIRRWRSTNPAFIAKLDEGLHQLEQQAEDMLRGGLPASMQRVQSLVDSTNESVALGAAKVNLEGWDRLLKARSLDKRIAELEQRLEAAVLAAEQKAGIAPPAETPELPRIDPGLELG